MKTEIRLVPVLATMKDMKMTDRCTCNEFSKIGVNEQLQVFDPFMGQYMFHCFDGRPCFYENEFMQGERVKTVKENSGDDSNGIPISF